MPCSAAVIRRPLGDNGGSDPTQTKEPRVFRGDAARYERKAMVLLGRVAFYTSYIRLQKAAALKWAHRNPLE